MTNSSQTLTRIRRARDDLESILGFTLWANAPKETTDAVQRAVDALNDVLIEPDPDPEKENQAMLKELNEMLSKYAATKEAIQGTSERLDRVNAVCEKCNEGLDAFFAAEGQVEEVLNQDETQQSAENANPQFEGAV